MDGGFTTEQEELRRYFRSWLDDNAPFDVVRRLMAGPEGHDRAQWSDLAALGWLGMAIPEEHGGSGYGFQELAVLAEEMGRSLYPSPFLATVVVGASLVQAAGSDSQRDEILRNVAAGDVTLAFVVERSSLAAESIGDGWVVSGAAGPVLDGHTADLVIVAADLGDEVGLFLVDGGAFGLTRVKLDSMDLTRPLAELTFERVEARRLGDDEAEPAVAAALDRAVAALAMEQVGGAQACLNMSVAYAKERHQFGRPIGSFQAIKHMCADMLVAVESAKSATYQLAWAIDHEPREVDILAPLVKSYVSEAYFECAANTIQIHGGIGFTWEHNAHLYLKRAKSSQLMFGGPTQHRAVLADRLGV